MKKILYSYTILRYYHDVSTGECLNIGVVIYSNEYKHIKSKIQHEYGRLSHAFDDFDGVFFKRIVKNLDNRINNLSSKWNSELEFRPLPDDARSAVNIILPHDDSSLQFSEPRIGLTDDLDEELEKLYQCFVMKHQTIKRHGSRTHDEVWNSFKVFLDEYEVTKELKPVTISSNTFDYQFEHAWKNSKWHPLQEISMDADEPHTLHDRAVNWLGRATDLCGSEGMNKLGKLRLLIGPPQLESFKTPYIKALNLLHKIPIEHEIVEEDGAKDFAVMMKDEIRKHNESEE